MTLDELIAEWQQDNPLMLVHTSGSTGMPKPMLVEKRCMETSARITCRFLGLQPGDTALLCLPLDYIAGKMMVVRALTCGLRLVEIPPCGSPLQHVSEPIDFAAMVPLQVYNTLQNPEERERLHSIRHLLIGGGHIDTTLAEELANFPHHVWSTYGMTETLSHIALRRLNGPERSEWYTPLEGVDISLNDDNCLVINAPAVHDGVLVTHDIAEFAPGTSSHAPCRFRILGRKDNVICSGGIKIQIEEVERSLASLMRIPFIITKCSDPKYGEAVVMLTEGLTEDAERCCSLLLPRHWQPRYFFTIRKIPLTETGKPARFLAQQLAERLRSSAKKSGSRPHG